MEGWKVRARFGFHRLDDANVVDVPLDEVAAVPPIGRKRALEVDETVCIEKPKALKGCARCACHRKIELTALEGDARPGGDSTEVGPPAISCDLV